MSESWAKLANVSHNASLALHNIIENVRKRHVALKYLSFWRSEIKDSPSRMATLNSSASERQQQQQQQQQKPPSKMQRSTNLEPAIQRSANLEPANLDLQINNTCFGTVTPLSISSISNDSSRLSSASTTEAALSGVRISVTPLVTAEGISVSDTMRRAIQRLEGGVASYTPVRDALRAGLGERRPSLLSQVSCIQLAGGYTKRGSDGDGNGSGGQQGCGGRDVLDGSDVISNTEKFTQREATIHAHPVHQRMHQAVSVLDAVKAHGHNSQKATDLLNAKCPSHDATTVEQEYLSEYFANGECEQEAFETFAAEMGAMDRKQRELQEEPLPPQTLPIQHKNDDDKENPSPSAGHVPNQPLNPQWPPPPRPDVWGMQIDYTSAFACVLLRERLHVQIYTSIYLPSFSYVIIYIQISGQLLKPQPRLAERWGLTPAKESAKTTYWLTPARTSPPSFIQQRRLTGTNRSIA